LLRDRGVAFVDQSESGQALGMLLVRPVNLAGPDAAAPFAGGPPKLGRRGGPGLVLLGGALAVSSVGLSFAVLGPACALMVVGVGLWRADRTNRRRTATTDR
jgi:hypothetical protein